MNDLALTLAPIAVAIAIFLGVFAIFPRESRVARAMLVTTSIALTLRYAYWRTTSTLPPADFNVDFGFGVMLLAAECVTICGALISMVFFLRTRSRNAEADTAGRWWAGAPKAPLVDVFICTYNEDREILERTIAGASAMDYENYRLWVLDDGRRAWLRTLCAEVGCGYIARPDGRHAKAGNINHALSAVTGLAEAPDFISILDADFVVKPNFLTRAMALAHDPKVGIVQTPQHFVNPDPIQANLGGVEAWSDDQRFFFDCVMPSRDAWGQAFCCGTSSIVRVAPLKTIGGFPTDSVTEDYLLSLRMQEIGFSTVYLNEALSFGLAPEGLHEYFTQRGRWCLGFMQIVRGRSGPFSRGSSLGFVARLALIDNLLAWTTIPMMRLIAIAAPILFLGFGVKPIDAPLSDAVGAFFPSYIFDAATLYWLTRGRVVPLIHDATQLIAAPTLMRAVAVGLMRPRGHKFAVTDKGGDRSKTFVSWRSAAPFAAMLVATLASIGWAFLIRPSDELIQWGPVALFWAWWNVALLTLCCFVTVEQPRKNLASRAKADEWVAARCGDERTRFRLTSLGMRGADALGAPPAPVGATMLLAFAEGQVAAKIVVADEAGFRLAFDASLATRFVMARKIFAGRGRRDSGDVSATGAYRAVFARLIR